MKSRLLVLPFALLVSCSEPPPGLPPPAEFGDATSEVGALDSAAETAFDASGTDVLLADASDVMVDEAAGDASDCTFGKTCVGAPMPTWQLRDFQPKSARYNQTYGLDGFRHKVTVVALLSGW